MMLIILRRIKHAGGGRRLAGPLRRLPARPAAAWAAVLPVLVCLALAGCGFRLEGTAPLPGAMARTYVDTTDPYSEFLGSLRDALRQRGSELVASPQEADAVLTIVEDSTGQRVLSVSARNIPREYEIFYIVTFSLTAGSERLIEPESIVVTRSYTYDETLVLGKAAEERLLRRSLAQDLARQVLRRIEALGSSGAAGVSSAAPGNVPAG